MMKAPRQESDDWKDRRRRKQSVELGKCKEIVDDERLKAGGGGGG